LSRSAGAGPARQASKGFLLHPQADTSSPDWLRPSEEQAGLRRLAETVRARPWPIVVALALTIGLALLYLLTAAETYEAQADLLVTPPASGGSVSSSLGLITESTDPARDAETAARLVGGSEVAKRVRAALGSPESREALLEKVAAEPLPGSDIVAVRATENSPRAAQELANAFAREAVAARSEALHAEIDRRLPVLERRAEAGGAALFGDAALSESIAELRLLRSGPTPEMRVETPASLPGEPSGPDPIPVIALGILAGLLLGVAGAFVAAGADPKLRREAQLRRRYRLPVIGRIPEERGKPAAPHRPSPTSGEAYRRLRANLTANGRRRSGGKVILVTGSSAAEGRTTTAVNLASSLALAGERVILIEADLRRPLLSRALGVPPERGGVVSVLIENTTFADALTQAPGYGPNLQLLLADYEGGWIAELFSIPTAELLLEEARRAADYVIVDSPPLNEVVDALPLARLADDVLIVVRLGTTRLDGLAELTEVLARSGVRPAGFALLGAAAPGREKLPSGAQGSPSTDGAAERLAGARR
jgi:capsular exopolysaccharide synthesis family protein